MEGIDLETYGPKKSNFDLSQIKEEFAYLFVGHWMQGHLGHDRKNVGLLIKLFFEAFKNKKNVPALILKTTCVGASYMDRDELLKRIDMIRKSVDARSTPNVYLVLSGIINNEYIYKSRL